MTKSSPQKEFKHGRFGAVWAWAKGHLSRFKQALSWSKRRKKKTPNKGFGKAEKAYAKKVKFLKEHKDPKPPKKSSYLTTFDGLQVPKWIAHILREARKDGVQFTVISGYRSPEYSTSLCEAMCGAPTCPGRCAGATSNHSCPPTHTGKKYEGAVDVSPGAPALEAWCRAHDKPLYGNGYALGSADLNHFSHDGR